MKRIIYFIFGIMLSSCVSMDRVRQYQLYNSVFNLPLIDTTDKVFPFIKQEKIYAHFSSLDNATYTNSTVLNYISDSLLMQNTHLNFEIFQCYNYKNGRRETLNFDTISKNKVNIKVFNNFLCPNDTIKMIIKLKNNRIISIKKGDYWSYKFKYSFFRRSLRKTIQYTDFPSKSISMLKISIFFYFKKISISSKKDHLNEIFIFDTLSRLIDYQLINNKICVVRKLNSYNFNNSKNTTYSETNKDGKVSVFFTKYIYDENGLLIKENTIFDNYVFIDNYYYNDIGLLQYKIEKQYSSITNELKSIYIYKHDYVYVIN